MANGKFSSLLLALIGIAHTYLDGTVGSQTITSASVLDGYSTGPGDTDKTIITSTEDNRRSSFTESRPEQSTVTRYEETTVEGNWNDTLLPRDENPGRTSPSELGYTDEAEGSPHDSSTSSDGYVTLSGHSLPPGFEATSPSSSDIPVPSDNTTVFAGVDTSFPELGTTNTMETEPPGAARDYVDVVTVPIALAVGVVGNIITLVAMTTEPFSRMSWSVTLASLAVADTMVLLMTALNKDFVISLIGFDVRSVNNVGCKIFHFIRRICKINSSWCVVLVCVERFIIICFPLKAKLICTRNNTIRVVVAVWLLGAVYCATSVIPVGISKSVCKQTLNSPELKSRNQIYVIAGSILLGILPMTILLILTPIICVALLRYARQRRDMATGQEDNKYKRASAMLVSIHVAYIFLVLPSIVHRNIKFARRSQHVTDTLGVVVGKITQVLEELVNHAINFFLYTAFNPLFRKRLTLLFSRSRSAMDSN